MDDPVSRPDGTATLLVRRAGPGAAGLVAPIVASPDLPAGRVADAARDGGVLVLADVALPSSTPPVAAAVFEIDRGLRRADLLALAVVAPLRRRGLGRRLFEGAAVLLRADGIEVVTASAPPTTPASAFLASLGFEGATPSPDLLYWL